MSICFSKIFRSTRKKASSFRRKRALSANERAFGDEKHAVQRHKQQRNGYRAVDRLRYHKGQGRRKIQLRRLFGIPVPNGR